jgi:hypothetical protein
MKPSAISATTTPTPPETSRQIPLGYHGSRRERDDAYVGEIVRLSARRRIIIDRGGSQYIVQKMFDETSHGAVWRGVSYHATRDSLMRLCETSHWLSDQASSEIFAALPELASVYTVQNGHLAN